MSSTRFNIYTDHTVIKISKDLYSVDAKINSLRYVAYNILASKEQLVGTVTKVMLIN